MEMPSRAACMCFMFMYFLQPYRVAAEADTQRGSTDPARFFGCEMSEAGRQTSRPVDAAREKNRKVSFCRIGYNQSKHYDLDERLHVKPGDSSFKKRSASAFFGTYLQMLVRFSIDTRIRTG